MNIKEQAIKKFNERIAALEERRDELNWMDRIPKFVQDHEHAQFILTYDSSCRIGWPLDKKLITDVHHAFEAAGWEARRDNRNTFGEYWYPNIEYVLYDLDNEGEKNFKGKLECIFFSFHDGSTCEVVKVGTKTKEVTVHEVVCK